MYHVIKGVSKIETVRVVCKKSGKSMVIAKTDFDARLHKLAPAPAKGEGKKEEGKGRGEGKEAPKEEAPKEGESDSGRRRLR